MAYGSTTILIHFFASLYREKRQRGGYTLRWGICGTHFIVPSIFWNWFISSCAVYNRNEGDTFGIRKHSYTQFSVSWQQEAQQNNHVILIFLQKFQMYQLLKTKTVQIHWLFTYTWTIPKQGSKFPETTKITDSYLKIIKRISNLWLTAEWSSLGSLIKLPYNYKSYSFSLWYYTAIWWGTPAVITTWS